MARPPIPTSSLQPPTSSLRGVIESAPCAYQTTPRDRTLSRLLHTGVRPGRDAAAVPPVRHKPSKSAPPACRRSTATSRSTWDERTGISVPRNPALRHRFPLRHRPRRRPRLERHRPRSRRRRQGRVVQFQRVGPRVMLVQANESSASSSAIRPSASPSRTRSRSRSSGASPSAARSNGRVLVDATDFFLRDGHGAAGALRPGTYRVDRTRSAFYMPHTKALPEEHRNRHDADLRERRRAGGGGGGGGGPAQGPAADRRGGGAPAAADSAAVCSPAPSRASRRRPTRSRCASTPRSSSCPTATTSRASTIRAPATAACSYRRLQHADRRADGAALHPPPSPEKKDPTAAMSEPVKPIQYWVDSRRAGRREEGAGRRRELVEPGVRSRGLPQRLQGRRAARRRRSDGHPLQHDQLGAPLDARLEHRRHRLRSAHRRDHQGHRHARLTARSPGLPDLRRPALALHDRQREARRSSTRPRSRASASSPRTKSATRSASATTTTTAPRAGSR